MLYGSDRNRYHDIVVASSPIQPRTGDPVGPTMTLEYIYSASLIITVESTTKILRREIAADPLEAVAKIVRGVIRDTGILFGVSSSFLLRIFLSCFRIVLIKPNSEVPTWSDVQGSTRHHAARELQLRHPWHHRIHPRQRAQQALHGGHCCRRHA
jgi:hypothetical protein